MFGIRYVAPSGRGDRRDVILSIGFYPMLGYGVLSGLGKRGYYLKHQRHSMLGYGSSQDFDKNSSELFFSFKFEQKFGMTFNPERA